MLERVVVHDHVPFAGARDPAHGAFEDVERRSMEQACLQVLVHAEQVAQAEPLKRVEITPHPASHVEYMGLRSDVEESQRLERRVGETAQEQPTQEASSEHCVTIARPPGEGLERATGSEPGVQREVVIACRVVARHLLWESDDL